MEVFRSFEYGTVIKFFVLDGYRQKLVKVHKESTLSFSIVKKGKLRNLLKTVHVKNGTNERLTIEKVLNDRRFTVFGIGCRGGHLRRNGTVH